MQSLVLALLTKLPQALPTAKHRFANVEMADTNDQPWKVINPIHVDGETHFHVGGACLKDADAKSDCGVVQIWQGLKHGDDDIVNLLSDIPKQLIEITAHELCNPATHTWARSQN